MSKLDIEIYTDGGAAPKNPGIGGWGAVLLCESISYKKELSGGYEHSTNNRMELMAVIRSLQALNLEKTGLIKIYSDSAYVVNAFNNNWVGGWQKSNFKNGTLKNIDLWKILIELVNKYSPTFIKVKAHSGIKWNERADELCEVGRKSELFIDEEYMKLCEAENAQLKMDI